MQAAGLIAQAPSPSKPKIGLVDPKTTDVKVLPEFASLNRPISVSSPNALSYVRPAPAAKPASMILVVDLPNSIRKAQLGPEPIAGHSEKVNAADAFEVKRATPPNRANAPSRNFLISLSSKKDTLDKKHA